jgi:hypothetical protein
MQYRKMLAWILICLSFPIYAGQQPSAIQRYAWVGGNKDGTVVALMLSHFGPSSHAPFVKLIIKQANNPEPLFSETASKLQGDETDLAELAIYLRDKNIEKMKSLDIELTNDFLTEANTIVPYSLDAKVIKGWVDIENVSMQPFTVKSSHSSLCPNNGNAIQLEFWLSGIKRMVLTPDSATCWTDGFILRNVYRTQKALWFISDIHEYGLSKQDVYLIDVSGIKF